MQERKVDKAECETCGLSAGPMVPPDFPRDGSGSPRSSVRLSVVGEAPGAREVAQGKPWVGKAGKLLKKVLSYHGVKIDEVHYTNACLCRPKNNRTPIAKEIGCCRPRLKAELLTSNPHIILVLGATAAKAVLETTEGISTIREGEFRKAAFIPSKVVSTFHTAAALRNPSVFPDILNDTKRVSPSYVSVTWEDTKYTVATQETYPQIIEELSKYDTLAADLETSGLSHINDDILTLGISHREGAAVVIPVELLLAKPKLLNKLSHCNWIWQGGKFDFKMLEAAGLPRYMHSDTLLMHYALDERTGGVHDLEHIATERVGAPPWKDEVRKYIKDMVKCPRELLYKYQAWDADIEHRVYKSLLKDPNYGEVSKVVTELLIPASKCLWKVEYDGIAVDQPYAEKLETQFDEIIKKMDDRMLQVYGLENPRSWQQVQASILENFGIRTKTTDAEFLKTMPRRGKKERTFAEAMLEHRAVSKMNGTYVKGAVLKRAINGRVYGTFTIHGTETGRLSSRDPNLQNIPRDRPDLPNMRAMFVPTEGNCFVQADYNQSELRVMAVRANDESLLSIFRDGRSLHREVATRFFGTSYSKAQYTKAKNIDFGIPYGIEANTLSKYTGGSRKAAQQFIDEWFVMFPAIKVMMQEIEEEVLSTGVITSYFGRKRRFPLITNENKHDIVKEACNFRIQSEAADLNLISANRLHEKLRLPSTCGIRVLVHDDLLIEAPIDIRVGVAKFTKETMEEVGLEFMGIPFTTDVKSGPSWGELDVIEC